MSLIKVAYGRFMVTPEPQPCPMCHGTGQVFGEATSTGARARASYVYSTDDTSIRVGDVVLVPGNRFHPRPQPATVVEVDAADPGRDVVPVLRKLT